MAGIAPDLLALKNGSRLRGDLRAQFSRGGAAAAGVTRAPDWSGLWRRTKGHAPAEAAHQGREGGLLYARRRKPCNGLNSSSDGPESSAENQIDTSGL